MKTLLQTLDALANCDWHRSSASDDSWLLIYGYRDTDYILILNPHHDSIDIPLATTEPIENMGLKKLYQKIDNLRFGRETTIPLQTVFIEAAAKREIYNSLCEVASNPAEALYLTMHTALGANKHMQPLEMPDF